MTEGRLHNGHVQRRRLTRLGHEAPRENPVAPATETIQEAMAKMQKLAAPGDEDENAEYKDIYWRLEVLGKDTAKVEKVAEDGEDDYVGYQGPPSPNAWGGSLEHSGATQRSRTAERSTRTAVAQSGGVKDFCTRTACLHTIIALAQSRAP